MSDVQDFGTAPDGGTVRIATLRGGGALVRVMTWGASLVDFRLEGVDHGLVLGGPEFAPYLREMRNFGAVCGPVANRIAQGQAPLDGRLLTFERNEAGRTTLHGGWTGTGYTAWSLDHCDGALCRLSQHRPDWMGGFPGPMQLTATYALDDTGALTLTLEARAQAPTFCNLAHHPYWCLSARPGLEGHRMTVPAARYLPVDAAKIPLDPAPVAGSRFDFRQPRDVTGPGDAPLDHTLCLDGDHGLRRVCRLERDALRLDIESDAPGLQVYDGVNLNSGFAATHHGEAYMAYAGVAIEPQGWPDAPNRTDFPSVRLDPGKVWRQVTLYRALRLS